jgi:hypothetical protein
MNFDDIDIEKSKKWNEDYLKIEEIIVKYGNNIIKEGIGKKIILKGE